MNSIPDTEPANAKLAEQLGLSKEEYDHVCRKLERVPTFAELGVFSAMFSEHCSYKSSKKFFKRFPTTGKRVLQGPGENAGVIDIGEGWAVAFKMESHNHPSFIEPYQGAATGVGGILRDVFTMGARPVGAMNGLCFGSPNLEKTLSVVKGVVKGIGDYGNSFGVPTVAGQTFFHPCYNGNPLVNAFTVGLLKHENLFRGYASGVGNAVVYVGAKTGRDGVHGATMASQEFSTEEEPERPTVQVGDPFTEKLLLEATLEAMQKGLIVGIQDMGAAGITSSSFEMAHRAKTGLEINLDKIPVRENDLSAYELLLSESQERMLLVTDKSNFEPLREVFEKWDLHSEIIGEVVSGNNVKMTSKGKLVVDLPVELVADPLPADRPTRPDNSTKQLWFLDRNRMMSEPLEAKFQKLLGDNSFADASPLVQQYDSMVGNRTEGGTFDDAAVLRLRDIESRDLKLALSLDCNPRVCRLWPREGGRRAVAEAALNVAVRGAEPLGVTDCLNFGSPENPDVLYQFEEAIEGISESCEALNIPVVSGNVSFYNDTDGEPIYPTPMIGMVGLIEGNHPLPESHFFSTELEIALVGNKEAGLGGSVLASQWFQRECGKPDETDLRALKRAIKYCVQLPKEMTEFAIHDISDGGLAMATLEMAFRASHTEMGIKLSLPPGSDVDAIMFGESLPRLIVAYRPDRRGEMENLTNRSALGFCVIGQTNDGGRYQVEQGASSLLDMPLHELKAKWQEKWKGYFN